MVLNLSWIEEKIEMNLTPKLHLALEACKSLMPTRSGEICFRWISDEYREKGVRQQHLWQLAKLGILTESDRNKRAVYYRMNPNYKVE
jgi:hypothetical protein